MNVLIKYQKCFCVNFIQKQISQYNLPLCELFILGNDRTHVLGLQAYGQNINIYLK